MTRKIIQVPVDEKLLRKLDDLSDKQKKARAEVIREACQRYLAAVETEDLEQQYKAGYKRIPESSDVGEAQEATWLKSFLRSHGRCAEVRYGGVKKRADTGICPYECEMTGQTQGSAPTNAK